MVVHAQTIRFHVHCPWYLINCKVFLGMSVSINKGLLVLVLAVFCMCFFVQTAVSDEDPALTKYLHELDRIFGSNARPR